MTDEKGEQMALVPVREAQVEFYGDTLLAVEGPDSQIYVPLRPICDAIGLSWPGQRERALRNPVLAEALQGVRVTRTPSGSSGGGPQTTLCLPLDMLPGWLFGINAERVKPELREKILRYQRECFRVLWNAFKGDVVPAAAAPPPDLNPVEQALLLAEAVASMAREHLALEQRVTTIADYTRGFIQQTRAHQAQTDHRLGAAEDRLTTLELHLSAGATISEAQAAEIALAVKNVAHNLEERGIANPYQQVWGELYKRYRVGAYRNLPATRYEEALGWLQEWYQELSGGAATS
jgi:hypothetical protein